MFEIYAEEEAEWIIIFCIYELVLIVDRWIKEHAQFKVELLSTHPLPRNIICSSEPCSSTYLLNPVLFGGLLR